MGSFRIVTGSGYGRREITDFRAVNQEFRKLRLAASRAHSATPRTRVKKTNPRGTSNIMQLYDKVWDDTVRKANSWARETVAEMRASVPIDTGNLYESIHILKDECYKNKSTGEIIMVVGVDLDPAGGDKKLFAPPYRKKGYNGGASKYGRKSPPWKGYRVMPRYPNDYSYKYVEGTIEERFKAISAKNAKKILEK